MESVLVVMEINKAIERLPYLTVEKIKFAIEDHLRINSFLYLSFIRLSGDYLRLCRQEYSVLEFIGPHLQMDSVLIREGFPTNVYAFTHVYFDRQTLARRRLTDGRLQCI